MGKDKKSGKPDKKKTSKGVDPHIAHVKRVKKLFAILDDPKTKKAERKAAKAELAKYETETAERNASKSREEFKAEGEALREKHVGKGKKSKAPEPEATPSAEKIEDPGLVEEKPVVVLSDETDEDLAVIKARVAAKRKAREKEAKKAGTNTVDLAKADDRLDGETEAEYQWRKKAEAEKPEANGVDPYVPPAPEPTGETEEVLADPSTGQVFDPEQKLPVTNHKPPRPLVWDEEAGKLVTYTRVTSYIDVLEDKSGITEWRLRTALVGAVASAKTSAYDNIIVRAGAALDERNNALAKAAESDRKGKLRKGELGELNAAAEKTFKATMRDIVADAEDLGGGNVRSELGTHIHHLTEVYDRNGMEYLIEHYSPTPAELADVEAYAEAMTRAGLEVVDIEKRIVNDEHKTTGTLDRSVWFKPEGATRRKKCIADIKTGKMDYIFGKTAMQVDEYAGGVSYDPATHERTKLGYARDVAFVIHLPAGEARCTIYKLDPRKGKEGLSIAADVRGWRKSTTPAQALRGAAPFYEVMLSTVDDAPAEVTS